MVFQRFGKQSSCLGGKSESLMDQAVDHEWEVKAGRTDEREAISSSGEASGTHFQGPDDEKGDERSSGGL
jgi:hypothetical protein